MVASIPHPLLCYCCCICLYVLKIQQYSVIIIALYNLKSFVESKTKIYELFNINLFIFHFWYSFLCRDLSYCLLSLPCSTLVSFPSSSGCYCQIPSIYISCRPNDKFYIVLCSCVLNKR